MPDDMQFYFDEAPNPPTGARKTLASSLLPNMHRVRDEGVVFTQAHVAGPKCAPARFNVLTGRCAPPTIIHHYPIHHHLSSSTSTALLHRTPRPTALTTTNHQPPTTTSPLYRRYCSRSVWANSKAARAGTGSAGAVISRVPVTVPGCKLDGKDKTSNLAQDLKAAGYKTIIAGKCVASPFLKRMSGIDI